MEKNSAGPAGAGRGGPAAGFADKSVFRVCLLLLPAALGLLAFHFHEPWRDEIQAWLLARDLSVGALAANAVADGHPIGWHLVLKALMALGLPFTGLQTFSFACSLAAAALLVFRGPFPFLCKLLLLLSPIFLFLGVLARPYSLIVLLLFFHALMYPKRMRHPFLYALPLALLSQLMVLCLPYVGLMGLWLLAEIRRRERRKAASYAAVALLALCVLAACAQLVPSPDTIAAMLWGGGAAKAAESVPLLNFALAAIAWGLCLGLAGAWAFALGKARRMLQWIAAAVCLFGLSVNAFVYPLSSYHWYTIFAMLAALTWIARDMALSSEERHAERETAWRAWNLAPLVCACFFSFPGGAAELYREVTLPSSNLPQAAAYFRTSLAHMPAAAHSMAKMCPLLLDAPGKRFWNPVSEEWSTFAIFDARWHARRSMEPEEAARVVFARCPEPRPLLLFSAPWPEHERAGYVLLIEFNVPSVYDEAFYFYAPLVSAPKTDSALS